MNRKLPIYLLVIAVVLTVAVLVFAAADSLKTNSIKLTEDNTIVSFSKKAYTYTGKEIEPEFSVTFVASNGTRITLSPKTDYSVSFSDNKNIGAGSVTVKGSKNYSGKVKFKFGIVPLKVDGVSASADSSKAIKVNWSAADGADGYDILLCKVEENTKKHYDASSRKTSLKISSLAQDCDYKIKVRAYITVNTEKYYSEYSDPVNTSTDSIVGKATLKGYCTLLAVPTLTWEKVASADSYIILRSTKKDGEYEKLAKVSSNNYSDSSAALHETYYYKIKAVHSVSGKTHIGRESNIVKVQAQQTVFAGDSILESLVDYQTFPGANYVVKIGMGTYTFYTSEYYSVGSKSVTGCEKVISYEPDRVFMMFGMNETAYKGDKGIIEYYEYAIKDILAARPKCEIILLAVSPTTPMGDPTIPLKDRVDAFNSSLESCAKKMGVTYLDYTDPYKDSNGQLVKEYDDGDGCHWSPAGCEKFIELMNDYIKK